MARRRSVTGLPAKLENEGCGWLLLIGLPLGLLLKCFEATTGRGKEQVAQNLIGLGLLAAAIAAAVVLLRRGRAAEVARRLGGLGLAELDGLSGRGFEEWIAAILRSSGFSVDHVGQSGDFGLDLVARYRGTSFGIQAKRWGKSVGNRAVQEVNAGCDHYGCLVAVLVTTSSFTEAARKQAQSAHHIVLLIGRSDLPNLASRLLKHASASR